MCVRIKVQFFQQHGTSELVELFIWCIHWTGNSNLFACSALLMINANCFKSSDKRGMNWRLCATRKNYWDCIVKLTKFWVFLLNHLKVFNKCLLTYKIIYLYNYFHLHGKVLCTFDHGSLEKCWAAYKIIGFQLIIKLATNVMNYDFKEE